MTLTIALDVDGVLLDCHTAVHRACQTTLGRSLPAPDTWQFFDFDQAMNLTPEEWTACEQSIVKNDNLSESIVPYPGAQSFVKTLCAAGHDVFLLTAQWRGLKHWVSTRERQLAALFPGVDVVFTHAKNRLRFDWLLDDKLKNCQSCIDRAVVFDRPWNQSSEWQGPRKRNYDEFISWVQDVDPAPVAKRALAVG